MARRTHHPARSTSTQRPALITQHRRARLYAALIVLAGFLVYANSLSAPFIFDDEVSIVSNPAIRSMDRVWSQPRNTPLAGRPVAAFSFALNFAAHELDATAYRATNIAIHVTCALLLFGVIRRTLSLPMLSERFGVAAPHIAFAAALLWVVHPLTTDAVSYITQRTESLMALFYLLTLYASLRAHVIHSSAWQVIALGACALGMGTKESMVTAPVMVMLFDRVFLFESVRDAYRKRWRLYFGLMLTWALLAFEIALEPRANSVGFTVGTDAWTYLLNQTVMIARYLRLVFWPTDLVITYGTPIPYALRDVIPQAILIMTLLLVTLVSFRLSRAAAFLGAWVFITLAPSSSFIPIATEVGAERRMYLPLMAVVAGLVTSAYLLLKDSPRLAATVGLAMALGVFTVERNREYQSWLTLAQTTLNRWPSDVAHAAVGIELARARRDEDALPLLRIGARSDPRARYNLGITLFNLQRYDEAIRELEVLVADHPLSEEVPWARRVMGHSYGRLSRWPEAVAQLQMVLAMTPHDVEASRLLVNTYNGYGVELADKHRYDEAIAQFRRGLEINQNDASLRYNLATALFDNGVRSESLAEAQRALALDPTNGDAHHLIGKLLALEGQLQEGLDHLKTAAKFRPDDATLREDLQRVESVLGRARK